MSEQEQWTAEQHINHVASLAMGFGATGRVDLKESYAKARADAIEALTTCAEAERCQQELNRELSGVRRSYWDERRNARAAESRLKAVGEAYADYEKALADRQHGGVAAHRLVDAVHSILRPEPVEGERQ